MEEQIITKLISGGTSGLLSAICICAVIALWKYTINSEKRHSDESKERERRAEERTLAYQIEQREIYNQYAAISRDMIVVIENNTKVLQDLSNRIDRLEGK